MVSPTSTVRCEVCLNRYKSLVSHLRRHKYNVKKYKEEFPGKEVVSALTLYKIKMARFAYLLRKKGLDPKLALQIQAPKQPKRPKYVPKGIRSEETRLKMRLAKLGRKLTEEHRMSISLGLTGLRKSEESKKKVSETLKQFAADPAERKRRSMIQAASKGNNWKGGVSRYLYQERNKYRLRRIFGDTLRCFFPGCDVIEKVDCHHINGDHRDNPLDGMNWIPLCRRHHMLADGRNGAAKEEVERASDLIKQIHADWMKDHYQGEIKTYWD